MRHAPPTHQGDGVRESVRDYLANGLKDLRSRDRPADGAPSGWHDGYLEGSKRLARDLCRKLDIAWDDRAEAPRKDG